MKRLIENLIILIICGQGCASARNLTLLGPACDYELSNFAATTIYIRNLIHSTFQLEILDIIKDVNITTVLDDPNGVLQQNLASFLEVLPPRHAQFGTLATETEAIVVQMSGDLKSEIAPLESIYLQAATLFIKKYGADRFAWMYSMVNLPLFKQYLQRLFTFMDQRLNELGGGNFNQGTIVQLKELNRRYSGKYSNVNSIVEVMAFYKYFIMYKCLTNQGVNDFYHTFHSINGGNYFKDVTENVDGDLNDLSALNVNTTVRLGKHVLNRLKTTMFKGLPQTLIGGCLDIILLFIKYVLRSITASEFAKVVTEMNKLNVAVAIVDTEVVLITYENRIKRLGREGPALGIIVLLHNLTRFMHNPFKTALKISLLILAVAVEATVKSVNTTTLIQIFGNSKTNYRLLAITDIISAIIGVPTGS